MNEKNTKGRIPIGAWAPYFARLCYERPLDAHYLVNVALRLDGRNPISIEGVNK